MAPVMAAFAAGTALGPAVGGVLADGVGLKATFSLVGGAFLANAVLNGVFLSETQSRAGVGSRFVEDRTLSGSEQETVGEAFRTAVGQWKPLLKNPKVRLCASRSVASPSCTSNWSLCSLCSLRLPQGP